MAKAFIKEIFESIQGEALYIGQKQIFIRFCGCNLNCKYCDTDFVQDEKFIINNMNKAFENPIAANELMTIVNNFSAETISLTGGEPLLQCDFLLEFLPMLKNKRIYLETNGTLANELKKVINFIDIVSMDIKLPCATGQEANFFENKKFIEISKDAGKEIFAKIVLDKNYSEKELLAAMGILKGFNVPLIIQPMDCKDKTQELDKTTLIKLFDFVTSNYPNSRLIPQTHKFLGIM